MRITLWAPWRMQYIVGPRSDGCILCEKAHDTEDTKNLILARGSCTYVLMNIYPYNCGHLMIAPYRHLESLEKLSVEEKGEMVAWASKSERILRDAFHAEGFNIGMNLGKLAEHARDHPLHVHEGLP